MMLLKSQSVQLAFAIEMPAIKCGVIDIDGDSCIMICPWAGNITGTGIPDRIAQSSFSYNCHLDASAQTPRSALIMYVKFMRAQFCQQCNAHRRVVARHLHADLHRIALKLPRGGGLPKPPKRKASSQIY